MKQAFASVSGVSKSFGPDTRALNAVSLHLAPGIVTGLVGPDGAGKTTCIRLLAGLLEPDAGEARILDMHPAKALHEIGYMPQRFGLYEELSVMQNLNLHAKLRKLPRGERRERYDFLLEMTDLARFTERPAGKLSGGMKQKLGLACALIKTPRVLLLDEPGVGVDPISRKELWALVQGLVSEDVAVLWSTAYLDEAEKCDTVYLLNEGEILFHGPPGDLLGEVKNRVVRVSNFDGTRRGQLRNMLDRPDVQDGTLQGRALRLLLDHPVACTDGQAGWDGGLAPRKGETLVVDPVPPRFEDGFIHRLGGGPKGTSALAQSYRRIEKDEFQGHAIEARGLTRRFGDFTAADQISFSVPRGHIFGLLGPNGAGKSTTFKMLCGLLRPSEGTGSVAGIDLLTASEDARAALGYMAQKFSLYGDLSVAQNLDFFAGVYGLHGNMAKAAKERVIDIFDLGPFLKLNAGSLPLGFKQRLALAVAVIHQPPVLFLDEPTSGVDPVVRRQFWTHINGVVEQGVTVLVTTHFMDEAEYCDDITLVYRARQIATGSPDDLKAEAAKARGVSTIDMESAFITMIEQSEAERQDAEAPE